MNTSHSITNIKSDFNASIVVFLIALPLAMGIAIASGYPPVAGLITGVVGGILVGLLSGSPLQVSGAAAGLAVVVFDGVQRFGLKTMGVVLLLAGIFQVLGAFMRTGRWFQAVSPTVLFGMLSGIGILIFASQTYVMLDLAPAGSGLDNLASIPTTLWQMMTSQGEGSMIAFSFGLLTIAIMMLWPKFGGRISKFIPAPLLAVIAASIVAWATSANVSYIVIPENLFSNWELTLPQLDLLSDLSVIGLAIQLALIASAESLLCACALDQMHDGERTQYNRELAAQGIGNAVCGLLGALPMTGVIVRSSANLQAGAKTRLSAVLHGVWLLLFVVFAPGLLKFIPVSALAGLLVYTGLKLVNIQMIRELVKRGKGEVFVFAMTVVIIVSVDLLLGVLTGLALAGIKLLNSLAQLSITTESAKEDEKVVVKLKGAATFLRLPQLASTLESLPQKSQIVLQSDELHVVDHACLQHLETWRKRHIGKGGQVMVSESAVWEGWQLTKHERGNQGMAR